jgi:hypothetical protein
MDINNSNNDDRKDVQPCPIGPWPESRRRGRGFGSFGKRKNQLNANEACRTKWSNRAEICSSVSQAECLRCLVRVARLGEHQDEFLCFLIAGVTA